MTKLPSGTETIESFAGRVRKKLDERGTAEQYKQVSDAQLTWLWVAKNPAYGQTIKQEELIGSFADAAEVQKYFRSKNDPRAESLTPYIQVAGRTIISRLNPREGRFSDDPYAHILAATGRFLTSPIQTNLGLPALAEAVEPHLTPRSDIEPQTVLHTPSGPVKLPVKQMLSDATRLASGLYDFISSPAGLATSFATTASGGMAAPYVGSLYAADFSQKAVESGAAWKDDPQNPDKLQEFLTNVGMLGLISGGVGERTKAPKPAYFPAREGVQAEATVPPVETPAPVVTPVPQVVSEAAKAPETSFKKPVVVFPEKVTPRTKPAPVSDLVVPIPKRAKPASSEQQAFVAEAMKPLLAATEERIGGVRGTLEGYQAKRVKLQSKLINQVEHPESIPKGDIKATDKDLQGYDDLIEQTTTKWIDDLKTTGRDVEATKLADALDQRAARLDSTAKFIEDVNVQDAKAEQLRAQLGKTFDPAERQRLHTELGDDMQSGRFRYAIYATKEQLADGQTRLMSEIEIAEGSGNAAHAEKLRKFLIAPEELEGPAAPKAAGIAGPRITTDTLTFTKTLTNPIEKAFAQETLKGILEGRKAQAPSTISPERAGQISAELERTITFSETPAAAGAKTAKPKARRHGIIWQERPTYVGKAPAVDATGRFTLDAFKPGWTKANQKALLQKILGTKGAIAQKYTRAQMNKVAALSRSNAQMLRRIVAKARGQKIGPEAAPPPPPPTPIAGMLKAAEFPQPKPAEQISTPVPKMALPELEGFSLQGEVDSTKLPGQKVKIYTRTNPDKTLDAIAVYENGEWRRSKKDAFGNLMLAEKPVATKAPTTPTPTKPSTKVRLLETAEELLGKKVKAPTPVVSEPKPTVTELPKPIFPTKVAEAKGEAQRVLDQIAATIKPEPFIPTAREAVVEAEIISIQQSLARSGGRGQDRFLSGKLNRLVAELQALKRAKEPVGPMPQPIIEKIVDVDAAEKFNAVAEEIAQEVETAELPRPKLTEVKGPVKAADPIEKALMTEWNTLRNDPAFRKQAASGIDLLVQQALAQDKTLPRIDRLTRAVGALKAYKEGIAKKDRSALAKAGQILRGEGEYKASPSARESFRQLVGAVIYDTIDAYNMLPSSVLRRLGFTPESMTETVLKNTDPKLVELAHDLGTNILGVYPKVADETTGIQGVLGSYQRGLNRVNIRVLPRLLQAIVRWATLGKDAIPTTVAHEVGHDIYEHIRPIPSQILRLFPRAKKEALYVNPKGWQKPLDLADETFSYAFTDFYYGTMAPKEAAQMRLLLGLSERTKKAVAFEGRGKQFIQSEFTEYQRRIGARPETKLDLERVEGPESVVSPAQRTINHPKLEAIRREQRDKPRPSFTERLADFGVDFYRRYRDQFLWLNDIADPFSRQLQPELLRNLPERIGGKVPIEQSAYVQARIAQGGAGGMAEIGQKKFAGLLSRAKIEGLGDALTDWLNLQGSKRAWRIVDDKLAYARAQAQGLEQQANTIAASMLQGQATPKAGSRALAKVQNKLAKARKFVRAVESRAKANKVAPKYLTRAELATAEQSFPQTFTPKEMQKIENFAQEFYDATAMAWDDAHVAGIISDATYNKGLSYGEYIPMHRLMAKTTEVGRRYGSSALELRTQNVVRKLEGSARTNIDPFTDAFRGWQETYKEIARNSVAKTVVENWTRLDPTGFGTEIKKVSASHKPPEGYGVIAYFKNGAPIHYQVPEFVALTLKQVGTIETSAASRTLQAFATLFRTGTTLANPGFFVPNVIRDIEESAVLAKQMRGPTYFLTRYLPMWLDALQGRLRENPDYIASLRAGVQFSTLQRHITPEKFTGEYRAALLSSERVRQTLSELKNPLNAPKVAFNAIVDFGSALEETTKMSHYKRLRQLGFTEKEAAWEARNYGGSPDFGHRGYASGNANLMWMYLQANVNAITRVFARMAEDPKKAGLIFTTATALAMALQSHNRTVLAPDGSPAWNHVPQADKDNNFIILIDGESEETTQGAVVPRYYKIPKPLAYRVVYNPISTLIDNSIDGQLDTKQIALDVTNTLLPGQFSLRKGHVVEGLGYGAVASANPLFRVPVEQISGSGGEIAFQEGMPIEPRRLQEVEAEHAYDPSTSLTARSITSAVRRTSDLVFSREALDKKSALEKLPIIGKGLTRPKYFEAGVRGMFGGLGEAAVSISDAALGQSKTGVPPTGHEAIRRIPVLGPIARRFITTPQDYTEKQAEGRFYELAEHLRTTQTTYNNLLKRDPEAAVKYAEDPFNQNALALAQASAQIAADMSELRNIQEMLAQSPDLSDDEKREYARLYHGARIELLNSFNDSLEDALRSMGIKNK